MIVRVLAVWLLFTNHLSAVECPLKSGKYVTNEESFGDIYIQARSNGVGRCKVHIQIGTGHWYITSNDPSRLEFDWNNIFIESESEFLLNPYYWARSQSVLIPWLIYPTSLPRFKRASKLVRIQQH